MPFPVPIALATEEEWRRALERSVSLLICSITLTEKIFISVDQFEKNVVMFQPVKVKTEVVFGSIR